MKYFGTDGVRGRVGESPMTAEFALQFGWAVGTVLGRLGPHRRVVIGKDTRISGYLFESALESGLSAAGADTVLLGPMPTPAVAHLTHSLGAAAGIVISASHNPFHDNGLKLFSSDGEKLADDLQQQIEAKLEEGLNQGMTMVAPEHLGKALRIDDAVGRYIEFCKATIGPKTQLAGIKCVLDCANGATYRIAPEVFKELGLVVTTIHDKPNGLNINAECGSTYPHVLADAVVGEGADVGLAFDGDGDRVIMVDHQGRIVDGDQILYVLGRGFKASGRLRGGVVGTLMSNLGLEQALAQEAIPFERVAVGDRHVHERLRQNDWVLGGEASGHILCLDRSQTGCGIVSGLQVIEQMARAGRSLTELVADMPQYPQTMLNVPVKQRVSTDLMSIPAIAGAVARAEASLGSSGRVVLRPSGTEPVVRVMIEGQDAAEVERLTQALAEVVTEAI